MMDALFNSPFTHGSLLVQEALYCSLMEKGDLLHLQRFCSFPGDVYMYQIAPTPTDTSVLIWVNLPTIHTRLYTVNQKNCATLTMATTKLILAFPPYLEYVAALPWAS